MTRHSTTHRRLPRAAVTIVAAAMIGASALVGAAYGQTSASGSAVSSSQPATLLSANRPAPRGGSEWPITECGTYSGKGCAPTSARVDLVKPVFTHPTNITNPLFPVKRTKSVLQLGTVDGKPFRSETTWLPTTATVMWDGRKIEVVQSQYLAYLDGQIEEIALDRYAQSDDGAVWYLGEDVFDYVNGAITISEGTWLAGRDGPPAMIMPGKPKVGDVFRAENIIGVVFEEIKIKAVNQTIQGPTGPITGVVIADELKLDNTHSEKTFAPGYGEVRTTSAGSPDVEALALAVPTDALAEPLPAELRRLTTSAWGVLENARTASWDGADATVKRMAGYWKTLQGDKQPHVLAAQMDSTLAALTKAVKAKNAGKAAQSSINVAQVALDLQLRYEPLSRVEVERVHLHSQQLRLNAAANNLAGVTSQVALIEFIDDRIVLPAAARAEIDDRIRDLRSAADARNVATAADHAGRLAARLRDMTQAT